MKNTFFFWGIMCSCLIGFGQTDTLQFKADVFAETYFWRGQSSGKSPIFYNHTTGDQVALNLGILALTWQRKNWTLQTDFMTGTYSQRNLAAEPGMLKNLYQANLSYQINSRHTLVAGILPSHIGLESAKNWDNPSFSRSYIAENSPYYESGISWNFMPKPHITLRLLALTGWQHISRFRPAVGAQFTYDTKGLRVNSSSFLGNEGKGMRMFFSNYLTVPLADTWQWTLCSDWGLESNAAWHGGAMFIAWQPTKKIHLAGRLEYYSDKQARIMSDAFTDTAASINLDYHLLTGIQFRSEWKRSQTFGNEWMVGILTNLQLKK